MGQARARGEGGIRYVKVREGLYRRQDGRFVIDCICGVWTGWRLADDRRTYKRIGSADTLRAARSQIAAHVAGAAVGAVGA